MAPDLKLYQILEKLNVETKIGVEIQEWIEDTFEKKQAISMFQYQETKQLPMQKDIKNDMDSLRAESDYRFEKLIFEMRVGFKALQDEIRSLTEITNAKFEAVESKFEAKFDAVDSKFVSLEKRLDATNFYLRLIAVPIVGATLSGVGVTFLYILERLR